MGRFFIVLVLFVLGFLMILKTRFFVNYFGRIPIVEEKFGRGYSHEGWKGIGILLILISLLVLTKQFDKILIKILSIFGFVKEGRP